MLSRRAVPIVLSITALFAGLLVTTGGPAAGAAPASPAGSHSPSSNPRPHPAKDTTPPGPVTDLRISANGLKTLTLSWTDPTDQDFNNVLIRRAVGDQPPLSPTDGTLIAVLGKHKTSFIDHGLAPATSYSYTLFALDRHQNQSTATSVSASTLATNAKTGLRGKVTDQQGRPIVGLQVEVRHASNGNTAADVLTDSTGQYTATNLEPGNYLVCYLPIYGTTGHSITGYLSGCYRQQPYGYGTSGTPVQVVAGKTTTGLNDYLKVAGALAGRITDTAGHGLQGVSVSITDYGSPDFQGYGGQTAADGSYRIINLPASSNYQVCFYSDGVVGGASTGYLDQCYDHQQPFGGTGDPVTVVVGQTTTVNAQLVTAGAITGRVLDDQGQPAAGILVDIFGGGGTSTDDQGYYTVRGLATGSHQLCFDGSFTVNATAPYGYSEGCATDVYTVDVTAGQTATQNGTVAVAGAVGGTVTGSDGNPVEGVVVSVGTPELGAFQLTSTDFDGHYQLSGIPAGQYTVCFDPSYTSGGYLRSCYQAQAGGDPTPITVNRAQLTTVNQQLTQGASITGTITDAGGAPISGVQVSATGADYQYFSAITDENGQYSIGGLTAQDYRVCFDTSHAQGPSAGGYTADCFDNQPTIDTATPVTVAGTGTVVVNAQLAAGSAITGLVTGSDNSRLSQVMVQATSLSTGQTTNAITDIDGSYRLLGLSADDYTVCFDAVNVHDPSPTGYLSECYDNHPGQFGGDPVHVSAGAVTSGVDAELAVGGEVTGTVTDASGNPLQDIYVFAQTSDGSYYSEGNGLTGVDGRYQLTSLPSIALAICFDDFSGAGNAFQCYRNQPDPSTADLITPVAGQLTPNIDATLHP